VLPSKADIFQVGDLANWGQRFPNKRTDQSIYSLFPPPILVLIVTRSPVKPKSNRKLRWIKYPLAGGGLAVVGLTAYAILPLAWNHYEHNPKLATSPKVTHTKDGIPGDPLNIGLVGTQPEIIHALLLAGWYPADPVTLTTSIGIARSVLLKHPYPTAPVSNLYVFGRKQDLAFERPVGSSASQRHHIRLWQSADVSASSQPLWLGSATFDSP
jgi:LssY C-terminus